MVAYRSRLAGFWLGGKAGIAFAKILYIAHLGTENCGQQGFEVLLLLPPQHLDFMPVAHPWSMSSYANTCIQS